MFVIRFWGVRGSIPTCSAQHVKYGGNTSCVEIIAGAHRFVLDAGTGIRDLGRDFLASDVRTIHLLLSHTHLDHIVGLPFFRPAYDPQRRLSVLAGHLHAQGGVERVLARQMEDPVFPVPLAAMRAIVEFQDFPAGETFALYPDVTIRTAPLNHPSGATGYRVEHAGVAACYVTDTEHVPGRPDQSILGLIEGADLVIYDSTYEEGEFVEHIGWGHSTWNEGMRLCREAGARRLVIFHHEPDHVDAVMDRIALAADVAWPGTIVAREGLAITLGT